MAERGSLQGLPRPRTWKICPLGHLEAPWSPSPAVLEDGRRSPLPGASAGCAAWPPGFCTCRSLSCTWGVSSAAGHVRAAREQERDGGLVPPEGASSPGFPEALGDSSCPGTKAAQIPFGLENAQSLPAGPFGAVWPSGTSAEAPGAPPPPLSPVSSRATPSWVLPWLACLPLLPGKRPAC